MNIFFVLCYRIGARLGMNSVYRSQGRFSATQYFASSQLEAVEVDSGTQWKDFANLFSRWQFPLGDGPPDWFVNFFNGQRLSDPQSDWWRIPDFNSAVGDIKLIWELSRMDWVLAFAQRARQGDRESLDRLNAWLADWCAHNQPYKGPNWKCGQEASIRVMHLAMASLILGQAHEASPALVELVQIHLQRIAPTLQYAMAQDNNHGTSEAAALFIGGSWLVSAGIPEGESFVRTGRRGLENRASRLIGEQGSFSQYSLNYHRVLLDTFSMVEIWRRHLDLPAFSAVFQSRALAATEWLRHMVNPVNGDGPNVGANDGARLLQLTDTLYRDYRPCVQLSMVLFDGRRAYASPGPWDYSLRWLNVALPTEVVDQPSNYVADDGGFCMLRRGKVMAMLRYPRFRFRPSQADALHLDFWFDSENLLRDAGTYSYNTDAVWLQYFGGTASHNTVQFDNGDQMPRLSRFLLGDWLKSERLVPLHDDKLGSYFAVGYRDRRGVSHHRSINLQDKRLSVTDKVQGFTERAVLRWRLSPREWNLTHTHQGLSLSDNEGKFILNVFSSVPIMRSELLEGWESRHYLEKTLVPVLEVEIIQSGKLTTELHWTA